MRAPKWKKWQIFRKGNEGDGIKKTFDPFLKKVNEGDEKKQQNKNIAGKMFFLLREINFFEMFFYLLNFFFFNQQQCNARAGRKKTHVFL